MVKLRTFAGLRAFSGKLYIDLLAAARKRGFAIGGLKRTSWCGFGGRCSRSGAIYGCGRRSDYGLRDPGCSRRFITDANIRSNICA